MSGTNNGSNVLQINIVVKGLLQKKNRYNVYTGLYKQLIT
jgi:hypothetical protein